MAKELYDGSFELLRETELAIHVTDDGGKTKHWLPKSQVQYEKKQDGSYEVTMPRWLAIDKGIV